MGIKDPSHPQSSVGATVSFTPTPPSTPRRRVIPANAGIHPKSSLRAKRSNLQLLILICNFARNNSELSPSDFYLFLNAVRYPLNAVFVQTRRYPQDFFHFFKFFFTSPHLRKMKNSTENFTQKTPSFTQKAPSFTQKAPYITQKTPSFTQNLPHFSPHFRPKTALTLSKTRLPTPA